MSVAAEDCREFMKTMPDGVVDLVLTDPPYFIDGMDGDWSHDGLRRRVKRGVVGGIPVGMKFDPQQGVRLQEFMEPIAQEWARIVKPGGFVLCFSQNRLVHRMMLAIERAGFEVRDLYAWRYEGQGKAFTQDHFVRKNRKLSASHKEALLNELGGRKTPQLKPQFESIVMAQAPRRGTYVDNWIEHGVGLLDLDAGILDEGCPGTVMRCPKPRNRHGHMTEKPVDLIRHLIRIFTKPLALVFDPFTGSGTTGVAAGMEGRSFTGCEKDVEMARIAWKRIDEVTS